MKYLILSGIELTTDCALLVICEVTTTAPLEGRVVEPQRRSDRGTTRGTQWWRGQAGRRCSMYVLVSPGQTDRDLLRGGECTQRAGLTGQSWRRRRRDPWTCEAVMPSWCYFFPVFLSQAQQDTTTVFARISFATLSELYALLALRH